MSLSVQFLLVVWPLPRRVAHLVVGESDQRPVRYGLGANTGSNTATKDGSEHSDNVLYVEGMRKVMVVVF